MDSLGNRFMQDQLDPAIEQFAAIGALDQKFVIWAGRELPRQLGESACLEYYVRQLNPDPSAALLLAVHCQHLRRFAYPRSEYPEGREGYLAWRSEAARRSATEAEQILRECGITNTVVEQVIQIMTKQDRRHQPDVQTMQDALCLAFFRLDAPQFAQKHDASQVARIVRRTWLKMSNAGRALVLNESFPEPLGSLLAALAAE
jgi:hypothetical protein